MALTPSQQSECTRLLPIAAQLAARYRDDEFTSIAQLALVESVCRYEPWRGPIEPFVRRGVRQALANVAKRMSFERQTGLCARGGDTEDIGYEPRDGPTLIERIAELPRELREVAELRWLDRMSNRSARAELRISWQEYHTRLDAARELLR